MNKLIPIEFENQRIITTKVLADEFGTDEKIIQQNFKRNEGRFVEGKHYYRLVGNELKDFKANLLNEGNLKFASELYLWTDRGAARHAKILDTDEAWEVYEELEETYFRTNQNKAIDPSKLSPELQMFKSIFDTVAAQQLENKQIKQEINQTKEEVQNIRDVITLNPQAAWRRECNRILNAIGRELGDYTSPKAQVYEALKERAKCRPNVLISNLQKRARENGVCESKVKNLNILDVLENEPRLKDIYVNIVKEMAIKNNVSLKGVI